MSEEVLTLDEAAQYLKVRPDTVSGLLERGELRGRQVDGEWRTSQEVLTGYLDAQSSGPDESCCGPRSCSC